MLTWIVTFLVLAFAAGRAHAQEVAPPRKVAIVVGSNAAPAGRRLLRYTHDDARSVQQVLSSVGGFAAQDVHVLLDPGPDEVLAQLDHEIAALGKASPDALLLFYYSGHADEHALYPGGRALDFGQLRKRLDNEAVGVRVGIIDSCRGGAWTGTRGLSESEAFAVNVPMQLANEGSVLISSSSGLEDAHESSQLEGCFTHYWNAGLRGAGDRNGDLTVTLAEAFDYARGLTIRDTAIHTQSAQHPSYRMNLRGQHDLALAQLSASPTALSVSQDKGPIQLIQLDRGLMLLELPAGKRSVRLSVPPGRYLVRVGSDGQTRARELEVKAGSAVMVAENELELIGNPELARRGFDPRPVSASTVPDGMWEIALALGVQHGVNPAGLHLAGRCCLSTPEDDESDVGSMFRVVHGFSDRLQWLVPLPAFAYRGGDAGGFEWIPWGGLLGFGVGGGSSSGLMITGEVATGVDLRWWMGSLASLQLSFNADSGFLSVEKHSWGSSYGPTTWQLGVTVGYSYLAGETVTLNIAAGYDQRVLFDGGLPHERQQWQPRLHLGSVQSVALRQLPLLRVHLGDVVSLDGYAALTFDLGRRATEETYMLGATFIW